MDNRYDLIIVGAGTSGTYLAKRAAEAGIKTLVADKCKRQDLGNRLNVFHIDEEAFDRFGVPKPQKGDDDYLTLFEKGYSLSAYGRYEKITDYPFTVMKLPAFLKRLTSWAESFGAEYAFETEFKDFTSDENGKRDGVVLLSDGELKEVKAKLVCDCSGILAACRIKLNGCEIENFELSPKDMFYVILRYVILDNPEKDKVTVSTGYPYYKTWIAPALREDGAIIGVGANHSFEYAEKCYERFSRDIILPPHKTERTEKGVTPYRRPPHSFVADNFVVLGDAACITKPYSGEGITAAWVLCDIAAKRIVRLFESGKEMSVENLWPINVEYMHTQGADFAALMASLMGAVNCSREENDYEFKKDIIFSGKSMTKMNRTFANKMTSGESAALSMKIFWGVLLGHIRSSTVKELLKYLKISGKLEKHYRNYPENMEKFGEWVKTADELWNSAGSMADKCVL